MMVNPITLAALAFLVVTHQATAELLCHPQGQVVPPTRNLTGSSAFQDAVANLTGSLDGVVSGKIDAGWLVENTSFSLALVSLDQEASGVPLWEYHHLATGNVKGTKKLDRDSQYLIGSVSKAISDAILIRSGLNLDDPVTKYLPQLANSSSLISWPNITLRALASQLSGIPPNYGFSEYYYLKSYFETLGFPHIGDNEFPPCTVIGLNQACTKEQLLQGMLKARPVAPPMGKPVYSNVAYTILAYAIEAVTGMNYTEQVRHFLAEPFGMKSTFPSGMGNDSLAVIPPVDSSWGGDYAEGVPGGGLISSLSDLSIFLHSILSLRLLPTETQTRAWLQPGALTGSQNALVGAPWEIFNTPAGLLTPRHPRSISLYSKGGSAWGYAAHVTVVPDLGVGVVLLTAGAPQAATFIFDAALSVLLPGVDEAAREEAAGLGASSSSVGRGYVGTFSGAADKVNLTNATTTSATFSLDADSLVVANLTRNGSDILAAYREVWAASMGSVLPGVLGETFRLFPSGTSAAAGPGEGKRAVVREEWRIWTEAVFPASTGLPGAELSARDCVSWAFADSLHYGGEPIERVVFVKDARTGEVVSVEIPFLRSGLLERVKACG